MTAISFLKNRIKSVEQELKFLRKKVDEEERENDKGTVSYGIVKKSAGVFRDDLPEGTEYQKQIRSSWNNRLKDE